MTSAAATICGDRTARAPRAIARACTIAAVAAVLGAAGCGDPPLGPSLGNVTVQGVTLQPTEGNAELCCCRVVGTATNSNAEAVHVTLKFSGFDGTNPVPLATALSFLPSLPPNQPQPFEASGFFFNCSRVKDLKTEIDVRGLEEQTR